MYTFTLYFKVKKEVSGVVQFCSCCLKLNVEIFVVSYRLQMCMTEYINMCLCTEFDLVSCFILRSSLWATCTDYFLITVNF